MLVFLIRARARCQGLGLKGKACKVPVCSVSISGDYMPSGLPSPLVSGLDQAEAGLCLCYRSTITITLKGCVGRGRS